jgi:hypothetical protein
MKLNNYFKRKPDSIHPPDDYLGTKSEKKVLPIEHWHGDKVVYKLCWECSKEPGKWIVQEGKKFQKNASTPMSPEVNVIPELSLEMTTFYQSQVGVLQWTIVISKMDINPEVIMLAAHVEDPREGHLNAVFHVFAYPKNKKMLGSSMIPTILKLKPMRSHLMFHS